MGYVTKKIFDCQQMPEELKHRLFKLFSEDRGNDSYIPWGINSEVHEEPLDEDAKTTIAIDKWLVENGAKPGINDEEGEEVLISYWW